MTRDDLQLESFYAISPPSSIPIEDMINRDSLLWAINHVAIFSFVKFNGHRQF